MIEQVKQLATEDDKVVSDASKYKDSTKNYYVENDGVDTVKAYLGTTVNGAVTKQNGKVYVKQKIDNTELDNKNRIQYYYSFANIYQNSTNHPTAGEFTSNRNYLYRAYAYVKYNNQVIVSNPSYFTIYDMASIDCAYDATNTQTNN